MADKITFKKFAELVLEDAKKPLSPLEIWEKGKEIQLSERLGVLVKCHGKVSGLSFMWTSETIPALYSINIILGQQKFLSFLNLKMISNRKKHQ